MMAMGTWWVDSATDKRWYMKGRCLVGCFMMPEAAEKAIEEKKKELKEEPPDDLRWEYMKD